MTSNNLNIFLARTTTSSYTTFLGLGLSAASYFFWGNVATQSMGAITLAIYPEERKKLGVELAKAVELWAWGYKLGAKHYGLAGVVSGLSVLTAAFTLPKSQFNISRNYLYLLSGTLLLNGVYTVAIMLPTNNRLLAIRDKIARRRFDSASSIIMTASEEEDAVSLLKKWKRLHYVRLALGAAGWVGTLAAYVTTV